MSEERGNTNDTNGNLKPASSQGNPTNNNTNTNTTTNPSHATTISTSANAPPNATRVTVTRDPPSAARVNVIGGRKVGSSGYTMQKKLSFLNVMMDILPIGPNEW